MNNCCIVRHDGIISVRVAQRLVAHTHQLQLFPFPLIPSFHFVVHSKLFFAHALAPGITMLSHDDSICDMEDIPAKQEKALADSGAPPARDGPVNMWCLQFDDAGALPAPGDSLPLPFVARAATNSTPQRHGGGSAGGGRGGASFASAGR